MTEHLQKKLDWANKRVKYAWAKYYDQVNHALREDHVHYDTLSRVADDRSIPEHIKTQLKEMSMALKKKWECPVCLDMIDNEALEITNCGHYYCKYCLAQWKTTCSVNGSTTWKCGMCNRRHKLEDLI